jgi:hypothetical protein
MYSIQMDTHLRLFIRADRLRQHSSKRWIGIQETGPRSANRTGRRILEWRYQIDALIVRLSPLAVQL